MTNSNDPNLNRHANREPDRDETDTTRVAGALVALVALIVILSIYAMINRADNISTAAYSPNPLAAATTTPAPTTVPPTTTGSAVPSAPMLPVVR